MAAGGGEDEGFGEELANDAAACGSECGAHGELLGAGGCAGEQKVREVDADDEEDESDGAPEDDERAAKTSGDVLLEVGRRGQCIRPYIPRLMLRYRVGTMRSVSAWACGDGDAGFEAAGEGDHVAPLAELVVEDRG